jgi:hypothetical protein
MQGAMALFQPGWTVWSAVTRQTHTPGVRWLHHLMRNNDNRPSHMIVSPRRPGLAKQTSCFLHELISTSHPPISMDLLCHHPKLRALFWRALRPIDPVVLPIQAMSSPLPLSPREVWLRANEKLSTGFCSLIRRLRCHRFHPAVSTAEENVHNRQST